MISKEEHQEQQQMEELAKNVEEKAVIAADASEASGETAPIKKKRVVKGVRFNLETKRSENGEKAVKFIQEIQPVGEQRGLFPTEKPAVTANTEVAKEEQPSLEMGVSDEEYQEMEKVKNWLLGNFARDVATAKSKGATPQELKVKNFILLRREDNSLWNRVEFDSNFDFSQIEQILISPEEAHPTQATLKYAMIVLFGRNKNVPLLFPYCYQKQNIEDFEQEIEDSKNKKEKKKLKKKLKKKMGTFSPNELDNWIFVNSFMKEAKHQVNSFSNV